MPAPPRDLIPILSTSNFLIGVGAFVIVGLVEPLGADMGISATQAGVLMTFYALAYAVLSPILVALTGAVGRRRVMALGLTIFALSALVSALAPNLTVLNVARILAAAGAGMFTPVAAATAGAIFPAEQRARVLAAVFFGMTLAQVIGVPFGAWIAYTFGWRWAFWLVIALALPCIFLIWTRVPAGLQFQPVSLADLRATLADVRMLVAVLFTGSFLGSIYVLYTFIAPLLSETMGYGRDGVTTILMTFGIGAVIGNIAGGILADRFGWRRTLSALCLCQMAAMPAFSMLPIADAALFGLALLWSASGWAFMSGQQMRLIGLAGAQAPVVLALNAAAIYVGAAIGSAIGAWAIESFGIQSIGLTAGLCATFALAHITLSAAWAPKPR